MLQETLAVKWTLHVSALQLNRLRRGSWERENQTEPGLLRRSWKAVDLEPKGQSLPLLWKWVSRAWAPACPPFAPNCPPRQLPNLEATWLKRAKECSQISLFHPSFHHLNTQLLFLIFLTVFWMDCLSLLVLLFHFPLFTDREVKPSISAFLSVCPWNFYMHTYQYKFNQYLSSFSVKIRTFHHF